jgi:hypothetical protein
MMGGVRLGHGKKKGSTEDLRKTGGELVVTMLAVGGHEIGGFG